METIKKEKKADLEQMLAKLLNDLLRMGWKPFNRDKTLHINCYDKCKGLNYKWIHLDGGFMNEESRTLRELVSIDSGLWQFVCENGLLKEEVSICYEGWANVMAEDGCISKHETGCREIHTNDERGYRLIESALYDEDKLEDLILQNVKIDET